MNKKRIIDRNEHPAGHDFPEIRPQFLLSHSKITGHVNKKSETYCQEASKLTQSQEDYIKTIYILYLERKVVRVKDIAYKMDKKMPSVSVALDRLKKLDIVEYKKYEYIKLTEKGKRIGKGITDRYYCLSEFLEKIILIDSAEAQKTACKIEHGIPLEVYCRIKSLLDFYENERRFNETWVKRQEQYLNFK